MKEGVYRGPRAAAFKVGLHVAASGGVEWEPLLGLAVAVQQRRIWRKRIMMSCATRGAVRSAFRWTLAPRRVRRHKMLGPSETLHDNLYAL